MKTNEKLSLRIYRHKEEKEVYLKRNWGICGGTQDTDFYQATTNVLEVIQSVKAEERTGECFEHWMGSFNGKLYVKFKKRLDVEIDGYTGTLEKEIKLYIKDFEKVVLTEAHHDD